LRQWRDSTNDIGAVQERHFGSAAVEIAGDDTADDTAVNRQSAAPDLEDFKGIVESLPTQGGEIQSSSNDAAQKNQHGGIQKLIGIDVAALGDRCRRPGCHQKTECDCQRVPADRQRPNLEGDGSR